MPPPGDAVQLNIEELLNCPVCFEVPLGAIEQCEQGHAVCSSCRKKLTICPVCRGMYYGTRNYAMEGLIERMKKANIDPNIAAAAGSISVKPASNFKIAKNVPLSVVNPPVPSPAAQVEVPTHLRNIRRHPPNASKGLFACAFAMCQTEPQLPASRMLNHIRYYHKDNLIEASTNNGLQYMSTYKLQYIQGAKYVNAVQISDMGLFFLIVEITRTGLLYGYLRMVSHHEIAKKFNYELKISSPSAVFSATFMNEVRSIREPHTRTLSSKLNECIKLDGFMEKYLRKDKIFICNVNITYGRPNVVVDTQHGLPTLLTINNRPYVSRC